MGARARAWCVRVRGARAWCVSGHLVGIKEAAAVRVKLFEHRGHVAVPTSTDRRVV